jgi:hypothetical protein
MGTRETLEDFASTGTPYTGRGFSCRFVAAAGSKRTLYFATGVKTHASPLVRFAVLPLG